MEQEGPGHVPWKDVVSSKSHLNPKAGGAIPVLQPQKKQEFVGRSRQLQLGLTWAFALCSYSSFSSNCSPGLWLGCPTSHTKQAVQETCSATDGHLPGLTECSCRFRQAKNLSPWLVSHCLWCSGVAESAVLHLISSHECSKGPLRSSSGIFPSQEVLLHLFTGGGAQGFPCHVLVKSPELANYSLESLLGAGGQ